MRVALIADIHGNMLALDAVLTDLGRRSVDQIVCLGDLAVLGPEPRQVIARLRELDCPCVMGNTDAWLLSDPPFPAEPATTTPVADLTRWTKNQLADDEIAYLRSLPLTRDVSLGTTQSLLAFHASPRSLDEIIAAQTDADRVTSMLADHSATIFAGGHTHIQLMRRHESVRIVNPGSVGLPGVGPGGPDLPVNTDVAWAEYALLDAREQTISVEFHQIPLALRDMHQQAIASGMPSTEWWFSRWDVR